MLITKQELASGKGKHPVSSLIFACSYSIWALWYLFLSLFYFTSLHLLSLIHASFFLLFFPSLQLQGFLAVCHHLKEHQVPLFGTLHIAKHWGMETIQTLFLSHTHTHLTHAHARLRIHPTWIKVWYNPNKHTLTWLLPQKRCSASLCLQHQAPDSWRK